MEVTESHTYVIDCFSSEQWVSFGDITTKNISINITMYPLCF